MNTLHGAVRLNRTSRSMPPVFCLFERYWEAFLERRKRARLRADLCTSDDSEPMDIGITCDEVDDIASNRFADRRGLRFTRGGTFLVAMLLCVPKTLSELMP
jgi:hypothetical protein